MLVHKGGKIKNWVGECRGVTPTKLQSQNIFKEHRGGRVGLEEHRGGGVGLGVRMDVNEELKLSFCEIFFFFFFGGGGGRVGGSGWGGGVRVDVKKKLGEGGGQVGGSHRVDVNKELKFVKIIKKKFEGSGEGGLVRWGGGGGQVDVTETEK